MNRSADGRAEQAAGDDGGAAGCCSQWRNTNGITTRIAAGRLFGSNGHGVIRLRSAHTPAPSG